MKKFISLVLLIYMCMAVLSSCAHEHTFKEDWEKDSTHHWHECEGEECVEISEKAEHIWDEGVITKQATVDEDGIKTFTCTDCKETLTEAVKVVTTVTKEEWVEILNINNMSLYSVTEEGENEEKKYIYNIYITENCIHQVTTEDSDETDEIYFVLKDGEWYWLNPDLENGGWRGFVDETPEKTNLGYVMFEKSDSTYFEEVFDKLTYDEEEKCYRVKGLDVMPEMEMSYYFEDGQLVKIRAVSEGWNLIITVVDIGSTIVEVPEFKVVS